MGLGNGPRVNQLAQLAEVDLIPGKITRGYCDDRFPERFGQCFENEDTGRFRKGVEEDSGYRILRPRGQETISFVNKVVTLAYEVVTLAYEVVTLAYEVVTLRKEIGKAAHVLYSTPSAA